jgi:hypothetical protein
MIMYENTEVSRRRPLQQKTNKEEAQEKQSSKREIINTKRIRIKERRKWETGKYTEEITKSTELKVQKSKQLPTTALTNCL